MNIKFSLLLLLFNTPSFTQTGGNSIFSFLNISSSPRQVAMGGKIYTLENDIDQPAWNPSIITHTLHKQISVNYTSYLSDIQIGSLSYAHYINKSFGTLYGNINYLTYGSLLRIDEEGRENGSFNANDISLSIGYAKKLCDCNLYLGINTKFIFAYIDTFSSTGIAFDLGFSYRKKNIPFIFSIILRNIGKQLTPFINTREKLPLDIAIAFSYNLEKMPLTWHITVDNLQKWKLGVPNPSNQKTDLEGNEYEENISFLNNLIRHVSFGAELFKNKAINLRMGYNFRRGKELQLQNVRSFGGLSFGIGIKNKYFKFNYAYSKFHSAKNTNTFGIQIDLDKD